MPRLSGIEWNSEVVHNLFRQYPSTFSIEALTIELGLIFACSPPNVRTVQRHLSKFRKTNNVPYTGGAVIDWGSQAVIDALMSYPTVSFNDVKLAISAASCGAMPATRTLRRHLAHRCNPQPSVSVSVLTDSSSVSNTDDILTAYVPKFVPDVVCPNGGHKKQFLPAAFVRNNILNTTNIRVTVPDIREYRVTGEKSLILQQYKCSRCDNLFASGSLGPVSTGTLNKISCKFSYSRTHHPDCEPLIVEKAIVRDADRESRYNMRIHETPPVQAHRQVLHHLQNTYENEEVSVYLATLDESGRRLRDHYYHSKNRVVNGVMPDRYKPYILNDDHSQVICIASKEMLGLFATAEIIVADATFDCVPNGFRQIHMFHARMQEGDERAKFKPVCYTLMRNKSEFAYNNMMDIILSKLPGPVAFTRIHVDFEPAQRNALRRAFGSEKVKGCSFHLPHCVTKKSDRLKLKTWSRDYDLIWTYTRLIPSSFYLPEADITRYYNLLLRFYPKKPVSEEDWPDDGLAKLAVYSKHWLKDATSHFGLRYVQNTNAGEAENGAFQKMLNDHPTESAFYDEVICRCEEISLTVLRFQKKLYTVPLVSNRYRDKDRLLENLESRYLTNRVSDMNDDEFLLHATRYILTVISLNKTTRNTKRILPMVLAENDELYEQLDFSRLVSAESVIEACQARTTQGFYSVYLPGITWLEDLCNKMSVPFTLDARIVHMESHDELPANLLCDEVSPDNTLARSLSILFTGIESNFRDIQTLIGTPNFTVQTASTVLGLNIILRKMPTANIVCISPNGSTQDPDLPTIVLEEFNRTYNPVTTMSNE